MKKCHACGKEWEGSPGTQPGRGETCVQCGADLHCCLNCKLYDLSASHQCLSRTTEAVRDKTKRNFCDEFEFSGKSADQKPPEDIQKRWKDLFKD